jgi:hypothetical protein
MGSFEEARDVMGGDWYSLEENKFGDAVVLKALTDFYLDYMHNGNDNIEPNRFPEKYLKAVSEMSEDEILTWARIMAMSDESVADKTEKKPLRVFNEFEEAARRFRDQCREILGKDALKKKVQ